MAKSTASSKKLTLEELSHVMRTVRRHLDLTQMYVAEKLEISQGSLSKMESGKAEPSALQWFAFCQMTGLPMDVLVRNDFKLDALKPVSRGRKSSGGRR